MSLALLVLDARFRYVEGLRGALALVVYPLQRIATAPVDFGAGVIDYFRIQSSLIEDNQRLKAQALTLARDAQRYQAAQAEAEQLRRLIGAAERIEVRTLPAEVLYTARDPYSHKVFIDRGTTHDVRPGSPVADETGLVGQVTRVHALASEVTLITDREQVTPVQVVRNGLRAVAFGGGISGLLELRFTVTNAEIQVGDRLVTSGIDGTYPAGLPVAAVVRIERDADNSFARVFCLPSAGVDRGRYVLVLSSDALRPPKPEAAERSKERRADKSRRGKTKDAAKQAATTKDGDGK